MEHYRYQLSGNGSGTQYTEPSTSLTDLILMGLRCTVTQSWNKMSASLAFHGLTTKSKLNITSYNLHNIHPRVILWSCKHGNINILSIGVFCRKGTFVLVLLLWTMRMPLQTNKLTKKYCYHVLTPYACGLSAFKILNV